MKSFTHAISASLALLVCALLATPAAAQSFEVQTRTLKNGLTVLLMEQREVPIVSFNFIIKAGTVADPAGKAGLASLTAGL